MTQVTNNYAVVLHSLDLSHSDIDRAREIITSGSKLIAVFCDPRVTFEQKENVINRIFDGKMASFLKVVCKNNKASSLPDIFEAYDTVCNLADGTLVATVYCTVPPTDEQQNKICDFVCKRYGAKQAKLEIVIDKSVIGGFILRCGDMEFDRSLKGKLNKLQQKLIGDMN